MRTTVGQLRRVIAEEMMHGVHEFELRQHNSDFVDQLWKLIKRYILINKSENLADRQEAIAAMNDVCDDLEEKVYDDLEDKLFAFTRRV